MVSSSLKFSVDILSLRAIIPSKTSANIPIYIRIKTSPLALSDFTNVRAAIIKKKTSLLYRRILGICRFKYLCINKIFKVNLLFARFLSSFSSLRSPDFRLPANVFPAISWSILPINMYYTSPFRPSVFGF